MRLIFTAVIALQLACTGTSAQRSPSADSASPVADDTAQTTSAAKARVEAPTSAPVTTAMAAFVDRVNEYVAFRAKVDDGIPKLTETSDPRKIADRERALGEALAKARANAKPGDIFVPEFQVELARIIKADFAKRTLAERKALIVELPKGIKFGLNQIYPTTIPLATFPPNLLKALPDLPKDLEYRIVYRHLILRDVRGNYVVDIVTDVFPIPV